MCISVLDLIVADHRRAAADDQRDLEQLVDAARRAPAARDFRSALTGPGLSVVAEIKRRSPSRGELAHSLDPAVTAKTYAAGGAVALSVLTDKEWFGGSPADLAAARDATDLPALRKDFTVDPRDVADARLMGADAVLLIVAALDDAELAAFRQLAVDLAIVALVEVHEAVELDRALAAGADMIGVNQRNLATFEVDRNLAARLRERIPDTVVAVAESGIRTRRDIPEGYDAILVGETLVTSADPAATLRELRGEHP